MVKISGKAQASLTINALWERTRNLLADNSPAFARLSREDQDVWLAAAANDFVDGKFETEEALPTLAYVLWFQGLSSVTEDGELLALLKDARRPEAERLEAVRARVQSRLEAAAAARR